MKIIHIYNFFKPKMGYIENCLPKEESKLGHNVIVLIPNNSVIEDNISGSTYNCTLGQNNLIYVGLPLILQNKIILQLKPDIVFMPYLHFNIFIIIIIKKLSNFKLVVSAGMPTKADNLAFYKKVAFNIFLSVSKLFLKDNVDLFIESTPMNVQRDIELFHIPKTKVKFLPLGADVSKFNINENYRIEVRKKYHISPDEIVIIYAGKLSPDKNIHFLLQSCAHVLSEIPKIKLMILGNGHKEYICKLQNIIDGLQIQNEVIFLNLAHHDDLAKYYNAADVGVWPGSPSITIQEALACGLPIIIKKSSHTQHLLKYGNGYQFDTLKDLINAIKTLAEDKIKREKMGMMSRKLAESELNWEVISKNAITIYKSILVTDDRTQEVE